MIRLVIVDDMPDIRNYLAEELAAASEQFSVVGAAEDGTEAVKLVDSLLPDVVLMDIQMKTRTEGIYAIRIIHERHPDIKCIALTIHEDDELIFQAYLAGAADYIIKTRSIDTIKNSILAGSQQSTASASRSRSAADSGVSARSESREPHERNHAGDAQNQHDRI
ncbi:MAG: response regulator transcription factor [Christensenellales bacterium]